MYYLLCNKDGKEDIGHFRLDRITGIKILEDIQRPISKLQVYNGRFDLARYLKEHPRMSCECTLHACLLVSAPMLEAVQAEFYEYALPQKIDENDYRVRIVTTRSALCNWIINVTDKIRIEDSSDHYIYNILVERANMIIENYKSEVVEQEIEATI